VAKKIHLSQGYFAESKVREELTTNAYMYEGSKATGIVNVENA